MDAVTKPKQDARGDESQKSSPQNVMLSGGMRGSPLSGVLDKNKRRWKMDLDP